MLVGARWSCASGAPPTRSSRFHLLRTRSVAVASAALFLGTAALFSITVFVPLFLQTTTGASPTEAGLLLVPAMLGITVSTTLSGRAIARTGRYKRFPIAGLALMTAALVLLAALRGRPVAGRHRRSRLVVFGLGFGMVTQVLVVAVQNSVDRRELGVATATTGFFRALGGAVGAAVLGAVFAAQAGAHGGCARGARATSSTASRPSSWSPRRSPRWRSSSSCACRSCPLQTADAQVVRRTTPMSFHIQHRPSLLRSEQTDGAISVIENTVPPRWEGPPLHHHDVRRGVLRPRRRAHLPAP